MKESFVLITGASSGIGKVLAIQLSHTYNVIISGRDEARLNAVKEECDRRNNHMIWSEDLSQIDNLEASIEAFIGSNQIEIEKFVHCAGYFKMAPLKMSTVEVLKNTFNTNVIAASLLTRVFINKKINNAALNTVVFISSNISNMGAKGMSAYGSSKGALDSLMRCLAVELAPKVRVNSVLPGAVITEMTESIFENVEIAERMALSYPLGIGTAGDIYEMVSFLLSGKAKWITGQQFTVDGGRTINISA